jgi:hypothetical protein
MTAKPVKKRRLGLWLGVPVLVVLVAYLVYSRPDLGERVAAVARPLWVSLAGTGEQQALLLIDRLEGKVERTAPGGPVRLVDLSTTPVTDDDLKQLRGLTELETLDLSGTHVTGSGFKSLRDLPRLTTLRLWGAHVSDETLAYLKDLPHLESLDVTATPVTDRGAEHLAEVPGLAHLELSCTPVTGAGLRDLKNLQTLNLLAKRNHRVDLAPLRGSPQLRELNLRGHPLTPEVVDQLKALGGLRRLIVDSQGEGDAGVRAELHKAIPELTVTFVNPDDDD